MLSDQIKKISSEFLEEAKSSPRLLTDMAAMEGYLAESYGERILIELLQNADDALSRKVIVKMIGATVFVANDGRPFTEDDLIAICRSGASKKERGQHIGYRGVGFKSTTAMTNNILISSNGCVFSFSKSSCAEKLGLRLSEVPTVRIPFFIKDVDMPYRTKKIFTELHNAGYTTIFAFEQAKKSIMEEEIREFDSSSLLFLRNVETIQFQDYKPTLISVSRKNESNGLSVSIHENGIEENWVVYKGKGSGSFAFKRSITGEIIEADIKLSVFHCYLPTLEQSPFKLKINADFSTDPSRKHLMLDSNTKAKLQMLTDDLTCLALKSLKGNYDRKILGALINRSTYAPIANDLYIAFSEAIKERNIILNGGTAIPLKKYLVMDDYFTLNEKVFIRSNSKIISEKTVINNDSFVERFIEKYCTESMPLDLYIALLSEKTFIKMCPDDLVAKLYAFSIKAAKNAIYNSGKLDINLLMIKDANGRLIELKNCVNKNLSPQMIDNLKLYCSSEDWIWFANKEKLLLNPYEIMDHGKIEKK